MSLITAKRIDPAGVQGAALPPKPAVTEDWHVYVGRLTQYLAQQQTLLRESWATLARSLNESVMVGAAAGRPAPGVAGRIYYATDVPHLYVDDGTAWQQVV